MPQPPAAVRRSRTVDVLPERRPKATARIVLLVVIGTIVGSVVLLATGGDAPIQPAAAHEVSVACGADRPPPAAPKSYDKVPGHLLKNGVDYGAVIFTSCGDMRIDLFEKRAPKAVNNFVFLAQEGFYDGLLFNQVVPDFIVQAGDPNGRTGIAPDGPGYTIKDELPSDRTAYRYGTLGFANPGTPDSAGSQFFLVVHDYAGALRGSPEPLPIEARYTVFGEVRPDFYGSLETIARQPIVGGSDRIRGAEPRVPLYINRIEIFEEPRKQSG